MEERTKSDVLIRIVDCPDCRISGGLALTIDGLVKEHLPHEPVTLVVAKEPNAVGGLPPALGEPLLEKMHAYLMGPVLEELKAMHWAYARDHIAEVSAWPDSLLGIE